MQAVDRDIETPPQQSVKQTSAESYSDYGQEDEDSMSEHQGEGGFHL